jgi:hypothetical protein
MNMGYKYSMSSVHIATVLHHTNKEPMASRTLAKAMGCQPTDINFSGVLHKIRAKGLVVECNDVADPHMVFKPTAKGLEYLETNKHLVQQIPLQLLPFAPNGKRHTQPKATAAPEAIYSPVANKLMDGIASIVQDNQSCIDLVQSLLLTVTGGLPHYNIMPIPTLETGLMADLSALQIDTAIKHNELIKIRNHLTSIMEQGNESSEASNTEQG